LYEATGDERLVPIDPPLPEADPGASSPRVVANEFEAGLAYWTSFRGGGPKVALVRFAGADIYFGPPNDEALAGHPLYGAGLQPYEFTEVLSSPWIAAMERRNRVHDRHNPVRFSDLRHFILPFHDSTFECVAWSFEASVTDSADPTSALAELTLRGD
jgi:hypothetical protein